MKKIALPKIDQSKDTSVSLHKNKKLTAAVWSSVVLLFIIWTFFILYVMTPIYDYFGDTTGALMIQVVKIITHTVPAFLLARTFRNDLYFGFKESFVTKPSKKNLFLVFGVTLTFVVLYIFYVPLRYGYSFHWTIAFMTVKEIASLIFVGVTEEFFFRLWLFNALLKKDNQFTAVFVCSVLFFASHIPTWSRSTPLMDYFSNMTFFWIFLLGFLFTWSYLKTKNIFVPIIIHTIANFLINTSYNLPN